MYYIKDLGDNCRCIGGSIDECIRCLVECHNFQSSSDYEGFISSLISFVRELSSSDISNIGLDHNTFGKCRNILRLCKSSTYGCVKYCHEITSICSHDEIIRTYPPTIDIVVLARFNDTEHIVLIELKQSPYAGYSLVGKLYRIIMLLEKHGYKQLYEKLTRSMIPITICYNVNSREKDLLKREESRRREVEDKYKLIVEKLREKGFQTVILSEKVDKEHTIDMIYAIWNVY